MNPWTQIWILAKREFVERGRSKPLLVTMAVLVVAIIAIGPVASAVMGGDPEATTVGLVGTELSGIEEELKAQGDVFEIEIDVVRYSSTDQAENALEEGDADVVLSDGNELVFHENDSLRLTALVQRAVDTVVTASILGDVGLSEAEIAALQNPSPLTVSTVEETDPQDDAKRVAAFVGAIVLYIAVIMFGQFVAMGTVEEKQNRVVEVVLSRVRSWQVLVGKVAGIGLLALIQLGILLGASYISAQLAGFANIDVAAIGLPIIAGVFFWFVLGYMFYAFLFAAVGSTVSRQEDLQGVIFLPIGLIFPGYLLAVAASENPDGLLVRVGSLVPMWAPFVMPVRIAAGSAAGWEIAVAVVGSIAGAVALVWIGARVYRGALLRTGTKVKITDAWRAAAD
ncbi:MAG: ABC transporter permease [Acidimicrobiia bacterium]